MSCIQYTDVSQKKGKGFYLEKKNCLKKKRTQGDDYIDFQNAVQQASQSFICKNH